MNYDESFDFVIVGSGAASVPAALVAQSLGKTAVILEKQDKFGGSTAYSGGVLWIPNSPLHGKVRGERSVMDFPFFALSKVAVLKPMEWQLGDVSIAIRPSATGMATMYDKEIILYIASLMAQEIAEGGQVGAGQICLYQNRALQNGIAELNG